jgi:hypothetical protein
VKTKKFINWIILIFFIVILAKPLSNVTLDLTNLALCDDEIVKEVVSPNNEYIAYVYIRNCGATTDEFYNVAVYPFNKRFPPRRGNISWSDKLVEVFWITNNKLEIRYSKKTDLFKKEKQIYNINVSYKQEVK